MGKVVQNFFKTQFSFDIAIHVLSLLFLLFVSFTSFKMFNGEIWHLVTKAYSVIAHIESVIDYQ